jgi:hypothetical protein
MDFVKDSAPVIQGQRTLSISSDDLSFTQSMSSGLATTVLPVKFLRDLGQARSRSLSGVVVSHSHSYRSPGLTVSRRDDRYSLMQNPGAVIAGIAVADAIQIGLAGIAIVQTQVNASGGSFQLVYDKAQRLLAPEGRIKMPGSLTSKATYKRKFLHIGPIKDLQQDLFASADIFVEWEGNPYGEIGTPVIQKDLHSSSDWSRSSAAVVVTKLDRIPIPGVDPRAWPIVYSYQGNYDPVGNGQWEFSGEFEINAFGGIKFNKHDVVSRSLIDTFISGAPDEYVVKGNDVIVPTPAITQEQLEYLKSHMAQ